MDEPSPLAPIPPDRHARWELLRQLIADWFRPLQDADGVAIDLPIVVTSETIAEVPKALREWFALAGGRKDIWSQQDELLRPADFFIDAGHLVFMVENQNVVRWGIRLGDLALDDPPVYAPSADEPGVWHRQNDTLSEFVLQMATFCLKLSGRWWASLQVGQGVVQRVGSRYPRLPFPEWQWPTSTWFYGVRDAIAEVQFVSEDEAWMYVVARNAAAAEAFQSVVGCDGTEWDDMSDDWPRGGKNGGDPET